MFKELLAFLQFADHPMAAGVGNKFLGPLLEIVMRQPIALRKSFRKDPVWSKYSNAQQVSGLHLSRIDADIEDREAA